MQPLFSKKADILLITKSFSMVNNYETVFILTPVLSDAQMKETVEKFKGLLVSEGAEIVNEECWGLKKLAYQLKTNRQVFMRCFNSKAIRLWLKNWKCNSVAMNV